MFRLSSDRGKERAGKAIIGQIVPRINLKVRNDKFGKVFHVDNVFTWSSGLSSLESFRIY